MESTAQTIAAHAPERILRLGFAVVRTNGRAVTSAGAVAAGDRLHIEVADGQIGATVTQTTK